MQQQGPEHQSGLCRDSRPCCRSGCTLVSLLRAFVALAGFSRFLIVMAVVGRAAVGLPSGCGSMALEGRCGVAGLGHVPFMLTCPQSPSLEDLRGRAWPLRGKLAWAHGLPALLRGRDGYRSESLASGQSFTSPGLRSLVMGADLGLQEATALYMGEQHRRLSDRLRVQQIPHQAMNMT